MMNNVESVMFCVCFRALGVPATDYVMEGRFPVKKLGNLSLPLESPAQETLRLLRRHRYHPNTQKHACSVLSRITLACRYHPQSHRRSRGDADEHYD